LTIEALEKTFTYVDVILSHLPLSQNETEPALYLIGLVAMRLAVKVKFYRIVKLLFSSLMKIIGMLQFSINLS